MISCLRRVSRYYTDTYVAGYSNSTYVVGSREPTSSGPRRPREGIQCNTPPIRKCFAAVRIWGIARKMLLGISAVKSSCRSLSTHHARQPGPTKIFALPLLTQQMRRKDCQFGNSWLDDAAWSVTSSPWSRDESKEAEPQPWSPHSLRVTHNRSRRHGPVIPGTKPAPGTGVGVGGGVHRIVHGSVHRHPRFGIEWCLAEASAGLLTGLVRQEQGLNQGHRIGVCSNGTRNVGLGTNISGFGNSNKWLTKR